jgi:Flp pilus assembly protein TadD
MNKTSFPMKRSRYLIPLLLALIVLVPRVALTLTGSQVYERVKGSVVVIMATDRAGKAVGLGSGVLLPSGDIVTNYHVVKAGERYLVGQSGRSVPAFLQASNPDKDLALLLASGLTATPARLGQASRLKVGEPVYAVGAPQGLELSLSEGIVSQLRGGEPPIIQTTVAISKGSSGGGLFNAQGELVGIITFYLKEGQGLNFAVPVEWIREVATSLKPGRGGMFYEKGLTAPAPGKGSEGDWGDRAVTLAKANNWQNLLAHCRQWTRAQQHSADAWFYLGLAFRGLGRHQEAIEAYREALRLRPETANAWNNLGITYGELGRYREAIEALREALQLRPDDAGYWNNLSNAYGYLGRYREAIEACQEALKLKPDDAYSWYQLAALYANSGNRAAALEAVKELRKYNPQKADKLSNELIKP